MVQIHRVDTPSLGDRSYLVTEGAVALVIDPQRDIDRVLALASEHGARITHVFETHLHNNYLTGGLALARETGAAYHVSAADQVAFDRVPVSDGDVLEITPSARVQVLATPGHTFTHLAYVLAGATGDPVAVFTGGSLLFGSTGRTDLLGPEHAAELARAQHASAARLAATLPDRVAVLPTHGFGSFCAAGPASGRGSSTIGAEKAATRCSPWARRGRCPPAQLRPCPASPGVGQGPPRPGPRSCPRPAPRLRSGSRREWLVNVAPACSGAQLPQLELGDRWPSSSLSPATVILLKLAAPPAHNGPDSHQPPPWPRRWRTWSRFPAAGQLHGFAAPRWPPRAAVVGS